MAYCACGSGVLYSMHVRGVSKVVFFFFRVRLASEIFLPCVDAVWSLYFGWRFTQRCERCSVRKFRRCGPIEAEPNVLCCTR